jgi:hypothetical protein
MATRSGQSYGGNRLSQQQRDDLLLEIAHQMGSLSKRVDTLWSQVFDTPECSGEKTRGKALKTINSKALKKTQKRSKFVLDSPRQLSVTKSTSPTYSATSPLGVRLFSVDSNSPPFVPQT